jgi:hypothetical protein
VGLHGLIRDSLTFSYVDDIRTSQETHLWTSTACYRNSFTFSYVDDDRTSQKTPMGLHGLLRDRFSFLYVDDVRNSTKHQWASMVCY